MFRQELCEEKAVMEHLPMMLNSSGHSFLKSLADARQTKFAGWC